ncbi:MAG: PEP-CTERM sorting domain-containing protein [Luteolibacter sp.]
MSHTSHAVIVVGGIHNDDPASLTTYLSTTSYDDFPYWQNLVTVSNASGVYLGYNPTTQSGWVLSAKHINPLAATVTVAGTAYTVIDTRDIGSTDLRLYQIDLTGPIAGVQDIVFASQAATVGEFVLMTGRGYSSATSSPYTWGSPGAMSWGTNVIEGFQTSGGNPYILTDFDASGATDYEGQGATGDSGGGLFIYRNGIWELVGIGYGVSRNGEARYGDVTAYSDVYASLGLIQQAIPETSTTALLALAGLGLGLRRRR